MSKLPFLTKNREFQRVYSKGKYSASALLVVYVLPNNLNLIRIGITASKKIGKSVSRNRMKRLIRENIRLLYGRLNGSFDIVVVARKADEPATFDTVGKDLRYLLYKLELLDKDNQ